MDTLSVPCHGNSKGTPLPSLIPHSVPHLPSEHPGASIHRLLRTVVAFIILFLTLRSLAIEPFGVPTGSMAPTLIGNHRSGACPRCGYPVLMGDPGSSERTTSFEDAYCPNCGLRKIDLSAQWDVSGDRLLVDKNIYHLRPPRRWEVAVFRCPVDDSKPYVKRVVGLPNEEISIHEGDVYANGQLLRKGLAEVRETRQPFFDLRFAPQPHGWSARWLIEPVSTDPRLPASPVSYPLPSLDHAILQNAALHLEADSPGRSLALTYRHTVVDEGNREVEVRTWNSYNGSPRRPARSPAAHDFALTCDLEVVSGENGLFSCRLFDGTDAVTLDLSIGSQMPGSAALIRERHGGVGFVRHQGLIPGRTYQLEFSFFDRRVIVALNGRELFSHIDLPAVKERGAVSRPLQLGVREAHVIVRNLILHHDIHYTPGSLGDVGTWKLAQSEYFMLGDNTINSQDSREWRQTDTATNAGQSQPRPGVPRTAFIGKPFLIHQPMRLGRLTVGGQERFYQTIDWNRLRWLH